MIVMKKANLLRYYYYGHIFGCDVSDMSFDEAVSCAFNIHKKQCDVYNLIIDSRSKELIINELKKLYGLC